MEERNNNFGRKSITPKTKKLHPRVDLTAMVSVSFLLIVFFMLTSFLSRSNAMDLGMPDKVEEPDNIISCGMDWNDDRNMTILLKEDKAVVYSGDLNFLLEDPMEYSYDSKDLTRRLITKNQSLQQMYGDKRGLIVLIKPSKQSTYGNLVNVLDQLAIAKTPTYAVVDITPEEEMILSKY